MLQRAWKPVAGTAIVGASAYAYYRYSNRPQTFELPVRVKGPTGKSEMTTRTIPLLPLHELETRIHENAVSETKTRPDGITWTHTTATLASNDPIEDANASQIVERDASDPSSPGDYLFFAVMDGHGGYDTSRLLSKVLIRGVALELSNLVKDPKATSQPGLGNRLSSLFYWSSPAQSSSSPSPSRVSQAIEQAFTKLDTELLNTPLRILANNMDQKAWQEKTIPDLSQHPLALTAMRPAISGKLIPSQQLSSYSFFPGSCALLAVFDTAHRDLYVACVGDSRAVAGVWEPSEDGKGHWRIEVLTEDQTGRNPSELARYIPTRILRSFTDDPYLKSIRSEHPKDEEDYVIREGRVLGGLEPSRAFGDARYKWPRAVQET